MFISNVAKVIHIAFATGIAVHCTEVHFASFLSCGFITAIVVNPPDGNWQNTSLCTVLNSDSKYALSSECPLNVQWDQSSFEVIMAFLFTYLSFQETLLFIIYP